MAVSTTFKLNLMKLAILYTMESNIYQLFLFRFWKKWGREAIWYPHFKKGVMDIMISCHCQSGGHVPTLPAPPPSFSSQPFDTHGKVSLVREVWFSHVWKGQLWYNLAAGVLMYPIPSISTFKCCPLFPHQLLWPTVTTSVFMQVITLSDPFFSSYYSYAVCIVFIEW